MLKAPKSSLGGSVKRWSPILHKQGHNDMDTTQEHESLKMHDKCNPMHVPHTCLSHHDFLTSW